MTVPEGATPLHTRDITVEMYDLNNGRMLIRGALDDTRHQSFVTPDHKAIAPGDILHGMRCEFEVDVKTMEILEARGETPHIPIRMCGDWTPALQSMVGVRIASGFNKAVAQNIGGYTGCVHFNQVVQAMGAAAHQGRGAIAWMKNEEPPKGGLPGPAGGPKCHVFAPESPFRRSYQDNRKARVAQPSGD